MFAGIIEEIGIVEAVRATAAGRAVVIRSGAVAADAAPGSSVAVNGACLTVTACVRPEGRRQGRFTADLLDRTRSLTNLGALRPGDAVNLERALRAGDRIGGHFVLGHVDGQGVVVSRRREGGDLVLVIRAGAGIAEGLVPRGSVAVDGVSLTVARVDADSFHVHCIPLTLRTTTLGRREVGSRVNLETDVIGRHAARHLPGGRITEAFLREHGFL
ncbi:MAG: riboflavin synthase [bacterium]|nr:riboflavin synthase [bacterium]